MAANYNNSAWFYDALARLVYGNAIINSRVWLINHIPANSNILIVGGGTGRILEELTIKHPAGLTITYVEIAPKMIALSQKRNTGQNKIIFMNDAIENTSVSPGFDMVLTPFLLDNFTEQTLDKVFRSINSLLKKDGVWLNTSFQLTGKWWQEILLNMMFIFFKLVCNIEASKLPGIDKCFEENGYKISDQKNFYGDFIGARVYRN